MTTIVALMLVLFAAYPCSGKYFPGRFFRSESRLPFPETALKDEDCKDDPNYSDDCPEKAAIDGYCKKHEDFMREKCAKSCGFCSEGIEKSPAPIDCKDDPDYADGCPEKAAMDGYCKNHEDFMREKCAKSCGFCSEGIEKSPAPIDCKDDPDYADGCPEKAAMDGYCKNHEDFMREKCAKSCRFCSEGIEKAPAPIDCKDNPDYADMCPEKAAIEDYCQDNEDFMRENCAKSCEFCSEVPLEP